MVYLGLGERKGERLGGGHVGLDGGTHESMLDAASYVAAIEKRQGLKVGSPEEIAWRQGFIDASQLSELARPLMKSGYGKYLLDLVDPLR